MTKENYTKFIDTLPEIRDEIKEGFYMDYKFPNTIGEVRVQVYYNDEYLHNLGDMAYAFFDHDDEDINDDTILEFRRYYEANYFAQFSEDVIRQIIDYIVQNEKHKLLLIATN